MIVEAVTVRNWRRYRSAHTFRFDEGLNLLVGRNEAGKSTLFEALQRGLFDRHNGKASEIKAIQPLDSSLGPEVEIVLRTEGARHRVVKRFLQDATSELHTDRGAGWELDHEGDKADEMIRRLFEGDVPGRGATKVEHRGLAQALWYLQDEAGVPDDAWNEALEKGLQGLVEVVAITPQEEALHEAIQDAYDQHWTPTGKVSSKSEIAEIDETIPKLEDDLDEVRATLAKADSHRRDLEEFRAQQTTKASQLEAAREELSQLGEAVEEASALEDERDRLEAELEEAKRELEQVASDKATVDELQATIEQLAEDLEAAEDEVSERRLDAKEAEKAGEQHTQAWKQEHEPALKEVEQELDALQAHERHESLAQEAQRLTQHQEELSQREEALDEAKAALAELHAPDEATVAKVQQAKKELEVVRAQAQASAIRVGFDLQPQTTIEADPATEQSDGEHLVTQPTTFTLEDIGQIHVRGGGDTLEDLTAKAETLEATCTEALERFEAEDVQALQDLHQRRKDLTSTVARCQERLDDLAAREDAPEARLARIQDEMESLAHRASGLELDDQDPGARRKALEARKATLIEAIEDAQAAADQARKRHLRLVEKVQEAETSATEIRSELKSKRNRRAELIARYGTIDQLETVHDERSTRVEKLQEALEGFLDDYEAKVERPRQLHAQAERRVDQLTADLDELEREIDKRMAKIETITEENPYSRAADLEARLDTLRDRRRIVGKRAKAAKLLAELVEAHRQERSEALAGPVADQVDRWLQVLTEESYERLELDEQLVPAAVATQRYQELLPVTELSFGTQEQVVVLLRLAIAYLLSEDERQLVVLDDRLVNADPVRMKRLGLILDEVSDRCQVLVATCEDTPYAGLDAERIRIPHDGREAP